MTTTEKAQQLVHQHRAARPDGAYGTYVVCACENWRGHRDQHAAHVAEALHAAELLRHDPLEGAGLSRVEVTKSVDNMTHVLIEESGVPIVDGYIEGPHRARVHPEPASAEPVEDRLRALADDMGDTPLTAAIIRQFADEVAQMRNAEGGPYDLGEIAAGWPAIIRAYAEREQRVRALLDTLDTEWPDVSGVVHSIVLRVRVALDYPPITTTDGTRPDGD